MVLLYIQLTISFLIGRKRTVNFWNQRLGRNLAANYTIIMWRTLKVTSNHVTYDRGAWFLRVIMSSSRALCCLPSVKKQKHDFQVCFVDWARHRKKYLKTETHKTLKGRRRWQRSCLLIMWKRKNWENLRKRKSWHKLWKHLMSKQERKKFVQCIIKQLLDSVFVISRRIKFSVMVPLTQPWLFWISQKPRPILVYN